MFSKYILIYDFRNHFRLWDSWRPLALNCDDSDGLRRDSHWNALEIEFENNFNLSIELHTVLTQWKTDWEWVLWEEGSRLSSFQPFLRTVWDLKTKRYLRDREDSRDRIWGSSSCAPSGASDFFKLFILPSISAKVLFEKVTSATLKLFLLFYLLILTITSLSKVWFGSSLILKRFTDSAGNYLNEFIFLQHSIFLKTHP